MSTIHSTDIDDATGVWFISAGAGGLSLTSRDGESLWSRKVSDLAEFVREKGLATQVMGSSTMDFASEEGFDTDEGANEMWERVVECL